jgi:hypothetical protein
MEKGNYTMSMLMNKMKTVDDYKVPPNVPKAKGMRVVGIYPDFDYKNNLQNAYGENIAKEEGIDEKVRDTIAKAINADEWKPEHYPKPATIEKTDVKGMHNQLTGFTTRSGHIKANKDTMFVYEVEFFDAPDDNGVMQPAKFWKRAWRTKENVNEEFDYIKSKYNQNNVIKGAAELLEIGAYATDDEGKYQRSNISSCLKSVGIVNPSDTWINLVREKINPLVGVMTNAEDFDTTDNSKLKDSVIVTAKTFSDIKDPKADSQTVDALEKQIADKADEIKKKLENKEEFDISVVAKTKGALMEKATKIRESKGKTFLDIHKERYERYKVIHDLVENHGFSLEDVLKVFWRGQKPDETQGEIYD